MPKKIAVVYHFFPHYRAGIIKKLHESEFDVVFFGSQGQAEFGIKPFDFDTHYDLRSAPFCKLGRCYIQVGFFSALLRRDISHVIFLANPNFISTWIGGIVGRLTGKKVLFWMHGWLSKEDGTKAFLRNIFTRIAHSILVYGERAREIGISYGFDPRRIHVVYNSLDHSDQILQRSALGAVAKKSVFCGIFKDVDLLTIICTARLTRQCRFDLLLEAAYELKVKYGLDSNIVLVGGGPELNALQSLSTRLSLNVAFIGECYDEAKLSKLIYHSDVTVSPGKVGLTAIHSLTYGTPVFSHGNLDNQMPEFEAVIAGQTGDFFMEGNSADLARVIYKWHSARRNRESVREACYAVVDKVFNPNFQMNVIRQAILGSPATGDFCVKSIFQDPV